MSYAVVVRGLVKRFGSVVAADHVSFAVERGETVALLGPNASGKTTILRCVAGLLRPDAGSIEIDGYDLDRHYRLSRSRFAFVPQEAVFPSTLTAREVLEFHARLRGLDRERVEAALSLGGLAGDDAKKSAGALSGGMRQRLSLAVAGLGEVGLLLLDEPTASLDPEAALAFRERAQGWRREGRALLLSTHVLTDVEELADRVVVLVDGAVIIDQGREELRRRLGSYARLRVEVTSPGERHIAAAMAAGASRAVIDTNAILITAPAEVHYPILRRLAKEGEIRHFETAEPSLEQIYMEYLHRRGTGLSAEEVA